MKKIMSAAMAAAMAMSLVACGGSASSSAAPAASGASADSITIGLLAPLSGDAAVYGQAVRNGAMLYINEINAKGGINGKQINVIEYDEKGDATEAVTAFTKMVDEGITGLIGDVTTTPTEAVVAESQDYNMPMITASATAEAVTYDVESDTLYANAFRACFIDPFQGTKMADYAFNKMGAKTAAVIYQTGNDYSEGLNANFVEEFEKLGGKVVDSEGYAKGDVDFNAQLTNINASGVDIVFCPNYYEDNGKIVKQARAIGIEAPFVGGDGWGGVCDYATAEELEGSIFCSGYAGGSNPEWEAAYKEAYGEAFPNMFSPLGYDAAMTMCIGLQAAEDAGLEAGSDEYKQAVIDGMKNATVNGVTGEFTFDEHNNPTKQTAILTIHDGAEQLVEMY